MIEQADFRALVEQTVAVPGRDHMRPVIEKELLHWLWVSEIGGLLQQVKRQLTDGSDDEAFKM